MEFNIHLASIVCTLVLLSKQISGASFPTWLEAIRMELSNVLSQPVLIQNQRYRAALPRSLQREIVAEPWLASMSVEDLVRQVEDSLRTAAGTLDHISQELEAVFDSDPTVYSVVRRGLPPIRNADVIVEVVDATAETFGIEYNTLEEPVRTMYYGLFRRRQLFHGTNSLPYDNRHL
jgi:hypothetical protein